LSSPLLYSILIVLYSQLELDSGEALKTRREQDFMGEPETKRSEAIACRL